MEEPSRKRRRAIKVEVDQEAPDDFVPRADYDALKRHADKLSEKARLVSGLEEKVAALSQPQGAVAVDAQDLEDFQASLGIGVVLKFGHWLSVRRPKAPVEHWRMLCPHEKGMPVLAAIVLFRRLRAGSQDDVLHSLATVADSVATDVHPVASWLLRHLRWNLLQFQDVSKKSVPFDICFMAAIISKIGNFRWGLESVCFDLSLWESSWTGQVFDAIINKAEFDLPDKCFYIDSAHVLLVCATEPAPLLLAFFYNDETFGRVERVKVGSNIELTVNSAQWKVDLTEELEDWLMTRWECVH